MCHIGLFRHAQAFNVAKVEAGDTPTGSLDT
jgi:hypothetical protein